MNDKFEMLLNELETTSAKPKSASASAQPQRNVFGSRIGEQREIVIRYAVGREQDAKVYIGGDNQEDSVAMLYATGNTIGRTYDIDAKKVTKSLVMAVSKALFSKLFDGLEELFK